MSHGFARISTDQNLWGGVGWWVMAAATSPLKHSPLTEKIIGVLYDVYNELGRCFLESSCAESMVVALESAGFAVARELPVPVWFRGRKVGQYFADMMVES